MTTPNEADAMSRRMLAAMETLARELPEVREQLAENLKELRKLNAGLAAAASKLGGAALGKGLLGAFFKG